MNRVVHFEIPADQPERAVSFYSNVFGWQFQKWDGPIPYWMVLTGQDGPGINGGLMPRQNPGQGPTNVIDVASVDASAAAVQSNGGQIVVPKMAVPGIGWLVYCTDPEGNIFGMMQNDPGAQ
jgi:predicted enzyme related to lactoylglutathione lyase